MSQTVREIAERLRLKTWATKDILDICAHVLASPTEAPGEMYATSANDKAHWVADQFGGGNFEMWIEAEMVYDTIYDLRAQLQAAGEREKQLEIGLDRHSRHADQLCRELEALKYTSAQLVDEWGREVEHWKKRCFAIGEAAETIGVVFSQGADGTKAEIPAATPPEEEHPDTACSNCEASLASHSIERFTLRPYCRIGVGYFSAALATPEVQP